MFVRDFTVKDITAINELLNKELGKCVEANKLKSTISNMIDDGNYKIFVAEINGNIVGFTGVHFGLAFEIDGKVMRIIALAVKEEYQHRGIGTMLIKKAEECAKENGASIVGVNSGLQRLAAHSFYENQGFFKKGYSFIKILN
ncbi:MAG: GNAT family N-acetyltransferase [Clostridia bacterium]|nr:GNAT family N-acetyltransferase [Clostridia bacterium]